MNYFAKQDQARKYTLQLIALLVAAVLTLIALTTVFVTFFVYFFQNHANSIDATNTDQPSLAHHFTLLLTSPYFAWIALGVITLVIGASFLKHLQLRHGGHYVATSLGGRRLDHDNANIREKKLLNIVEEMAIASGTPIPTVYLLDENGINAFAAGYQRDQAVIGITRGAIEKLNRDELQGVIGHEFSHIYNGDMKLNLNLVAVLNGILAIGFIGELVLRGSLSTHRGYRHRTSKSRDRGQLAILGIGLLVIGYGGTFFGNIIKAAVSRQREYLADASSVQFTRNPMGIGSALNKIAYMGHGSQIEHPRRSEYSHMYFANGLRKQLSSLFATHPPLEHRLQHIFPKGLPEFKLSITPEKNADKNAPTPQTAKTEKRQSVQAAIIASATLATSSAQTHREMPTSQTLSNTLELMQQQTPEHADLAAAKEQLTSIPESVHRACHNAYSARAVVYAMLLDTDSTLTSGQYQLLKKQANPRTWQEFEQLAPQIQRLAIELRLTLLELTLPSIKTMSDRQFQLFKANLLKLIEFDGKTSLFEWCLYERVTCHLRPQHSKNNLSSLTPSIDKLLKLFCLTTHKDNRAAAYTAGQQHISYNKATDYDKVSVRMADLPKLVSEITQLKLLERPRLLKALAAVIEYDQEVTTEEYELFRVFAALLDCPTPMLSLKKVSTPLT